MSTTSLQISLPEPLRAYVEQQVSKGDFGTPGEYVRDLIPQDRERRSARLRAELLDALASPAFEIPVEALENGALLGVLREKLASSERE